MSRKKLNRILPVRVTSRDAVDLRRWAREDSDGNVSQVIREMIEERRQRTSGASVASGESREASRAA